MDLRLAGKGALVTGGSGGAGREISKVLAEEGCVVAVHGLDRDLAEAVAASISEAGGRGHPIAGNLNDVGAAADVFQRAATSVGTVDITTSDVRACLTPAERSCSRRRRQPLEPGASQAQDMTKTESRNDTGGPRGRYVYDPVAEPELFDLVLSRRIVAFVVDAILIVLLLIPASLLLAIVGIVTLGIAWLLFPALFAIVALAYVGLTLGGPASATVGMRMTGLEMRTWSGDGMFPLLAVMHALLFWFSVGLLTPLILLVGLFTYRKQLLHDLLLGVVMLNSAPLRDGGK